MVAHARGVLAHLLVGLSLDICGAPPVHVGEVPHGVESKHDIQAYLFKYGFMDFPTSAGGRFANLMTGEEASSRAMVNFQEFFNLNVSGTFDHVTHDLMNRPRCGNPDQIHKSDSTRRKRYILEGSKWMKHTLTYRVLHYPQGSLAPLAIDAALYRAFRTWQEFSPLRFRRISSGTADIAILFQGGEHGDEFPFDGRGNTLAHAFYPVYGGDMHFDGDEKWTSFDKHGTDLHHVAAHEIGHALGLGHSRDLNSLMAPFYRPYDPDFHLAEDDVRAIQFLYGPPTDVTDSGVFFDVTEQDQTTDSTTLGRIPPLSPTSACSTGYFDAITMHFEGGMEHTYAFRDEYYMLIDREGIAPGYPRPIASDWLGLPGYVDAALYWPNEYKYIYDRNNNPIKRILLSPARTYFFRGVWYWRYQERVLQPGYPKLIRSAWKGAPDNVDDVFMWGGNGETFFLKDRQYYRYLRGVGVPDFYPKHVSEWNLPVSRVDAVFQWENGKTYFFSGEFYYRYNDDDFQVDQGYPRLTKYWWLGCESTQSAADIIQRSNSAPRPPPHLALRAAMLLIIVTALFV